MIVASCLTALMLSSVSATDPDSVSAPPTDRPVWDIPIEYNTAVDRWLDYYQGRGRRTIQIHLGRAGRYEETLRAILREHGLPQDLVYLSMIESGFNPNAYSRAHAVGLWQFIAPTARRYGLRVTYWVDERRDPVLATHAAAAYLKDLYEEFGSWYLAAAAYNGGATRVRRAIHRTGNRDFWTLVRRGYFPRETRNYVPKFIAAALIAKQPERYGLTVTVAPALSYDLGVVPDATSLEVIAEAAGAEVAEIKALNPQLIRGVTPPGERYYVRLPPRSGDRFAANYPRIQAEARNGSIRHTVRSGDTLSRLARAYGSDLSAIRSANPSVRPERLEIGQHLYIPLREEP